MSDPRVVTATRPRPSAFTCSRSPGRRGAVWFHLAGEFDLSAESVLAERLREAQASSYLVVADLRDLEFIDCAGLGVLVGAGARARRTKRSFVIVRGTGQVDRMFVQAGLLEELEVVDLNALLNPSGAEVRAEAVQMDIAA